MVATEGVSGRSLRLGVLRLQSKYGQQLVLDVGVPFASEGAGVPPPETGR
jgi:hypothetical protein